MRICLLIFVAVMIQSSGTMHLRIKERSLIGNCRPRMGFVFFAQSHMSGIIGKFFDKSALGFCKCYNTLRPAKDCRTRHIVLMSPGQNRFSRNQKYLPSTNEDLEKFRGILQNVGSSKPEEIPSIIGKDLDFLLSRNLALLAKQCKQSCTTPTEGAAIDNQLEAVLTFLEEFVAMAQGMAADNKDLLREILQAASAGMDAFDTKIQSIASGSDPRYTPEFIRYLSTEISRLNQTIIAEQDKSAGGPAQSADEEEDEEDEDGPSSPNAVEPDARTTMIVLSMIRVRRRRRLLLLLFLRCQAIRILTPSGERARSEEGLVNDMSLTLARPQHAQSTRNTFHDSVQRLPRGEHEGEVGEGGERLEGSEMERGEGERERKMCALGGGGGGVRRRG
jgi:hypothetical protein